MARHHARLSDKGYEFFKSLMADMKTESISEAIDFFINFKKAELQEVKTDMTPDALQKAILKCRLDLMELDKTSRSLKQEDLRKTIELKTIKIAQMVKVNSEMAIATMPGVSSPPMIMAHSTPIKNAMRSARKCVHCNSDIYFDPKEDYRIPHNMDDSRHTCERLPRFNPQTKPTVAIPLPDLNKMPESEEIIWCEMDEGCQFNWQWKNYLGRSDGTFDLDRDIRNHVRRMHNKDYVPDNMDVYKLIGARK